jgi:hypothetical protein
MQLRIQGKKVFTVGLLASIFLAMAPAVMSADQADARTASKVTICHRTNATTNPYRRITVSKNAADGQGNNDHTSHNESYNDGATTHYVFNKDVTYPNNQKDWGDIIPPFANGGTTNPGYNWDAANAQSIYNGTDGYFGACKSLNAKQYIEAQVANRDSSESEADAKARALQELDDMGANEDAELKTELGGSFAGADPTELETKLNALTIPPGGPTPPAAIAQSISGVVWIDLDRDGNEDAGEPRARSVQVALDDPAGAGSVSTTSVNAQATTYITTDSTGAFLFTSVAEGEWQITATPPASLEVTYDSEGAASDGQALVLVPAGSHGFGWVGLVGDGSIEAVVLGPDDEPAADEVVVCWAGVDNILDNDDDICFNLTPTGGGTIEQDGLPSGDYQVESVDGSGSAGEFTLQSGTRYTKTISNSSTTTPDTDIDPDSEVLADTGGIDYVPFALAVAMMIVGGLMMQIKTRGKH